MSSHSAEHKIKRLITKRQRKKITTKKDPTMVRRDHFELGDAVVICRGRCAGKTGDVMVIARWCLQIALPSGFLVRVSKESVALVMDLSDELVDESVETEQLNVVSEGESEDESTRMK